MYVKIISPTEAVVEFDNDQEKSIIYKTCSYKNKDIEYKIKLHKKKQWLINKDPKAYFDELNQLEASVNKCLISFKKGQYTIAPGFIPYLTSLKNIQIINEIKYPPTKLIPWKKLPEFEPYYYQTQAIENLMRIKHGHISLPTGCHAKDTEILMFDGTVKKVQNITVGDELMGPDGNKRNVLALTNGFQKMYKIIPNSGESFCVNEDHILSLKTTGLKSKPKYKCQKVKGNVVNLSVKEYLSKSKFFKHINKLYRAKIDSFANESNDIPIDPYIFGLWLGGGISCAVSDLDLNQKKHNRGNILNILLKQMNVINNKHIPHIYKTSSLQNRKQLLAGLLDSDGHNCGGYFEVVQKSKKLTDDIAFLARSLGFRVNIKEKISYESNTVEKIKRKYYRINIGGDFTSIPLKIKRKKINEFKCNKNPLVTGFKVKELDVGEYFGFTVDCDHLYLMADFTVTHNCGKSMVLLNITKNMGINTLVVTPSKSIFNELLVEFTDKLGKEMVGAYGDGKKDIKKKITIAIGKSLTMIKPDTPAYSFMKNKELLLFDESHVTGAKELEKVCHGILSEIPYRMFVSATQTRNNGTEKLLYSIIGENVLEMSLEKAINEGFLCPLKFFIIDTFSPSTRYVSDSIACKREHFLHNPKIADYIAKIAYSSYKSLNESSLVLVDEIVQIKMLAERLDKLGVSYTYAHSANKSHAESYGLRAVDSKEEVLRFNKGEVKVLIGTSCISTGTNIFPTHNVCNWYGGSSEVTTKQGVMGRSTRLLEKSKFKEFHKPKPFSKIWDFNVVGQPTLERQLKTRIGFYQESGGEVKYIKK